MDEQMSDEARASVFFFIAVSLIVASLMFYCKFC